MAFKVFAAVTEADKSLCLHIRHIVFVEEQGVPVDLEIDEHDAAQALHFLGCTDDEAVAAARICIFDNVAKIQRVALLSKHRGKGLGKALMVYLLDHIRTKQLAPVIALDAQVQAVSFYKALGFITEGGEFDDAGIPHVHMKQTA